MGSLAPVLSRAGKLKGGETFSERPDANETPENKPEDWFFSLPCVSRHRREQCHL